MALDSNEELEELRKRIEEAYSRLDNNSNVTERELKKMRETLGEIDDLSKNRTGRRELEALEQEVRSRAEGRSSGRNGTENDSFWERFKKDVMPNFSNMSGQLYDAMVKANELDGAMRKMGAGLGLNNEQLEIYRSNIYGANVEATRMGVTLNQLVEAQQKFIDVTGRLSILSTGDYKNLITAAAGLGVELQDAARFAATLSDYGYNVADTYQALNNVVVQARNYGVSSQKVFESLSKLAEGVGRKLTFRNGVADMVKMVAQAEKFRINMDVVAQVSDANSNLENVLETTTQLANLGANVDPLHWLYTARNDATGMQDEIMRLTADMAEFNTVTGEIQIGAYNRDLLKGYSKALGVSFEQLEQQARRAKQLNIIQNALGDVNIDSNSKIGKIFETFGQIGRGGTVTVALDGKNYTAQEVQSDPALLAQLQQLATRQDERDALKTERDVSLAMLDELTRIKDLLQTALQAGADRITQSLRRVNTEVGATETVYGIADDARAQLTQSFNNFDISPILTQGFNNIFGDLRRFQPMIAEVTGPALQSFGDLLNTATQKLNAFTNATPTPQTATAQTTPAAPQEISVKGTVINQQPIIIQMDGRELGHGVLEQEIAIRNGGSYRE